MGTVWETQPLSSTLREGEALQWLVEKCGNSYHVLNNENRGDVTHVTELLEKMEDMVAGKRGGVFQPNEEEQEQSAIIRKTDSMKGLPPVSKKHSSGPVLIY